MGTRGGAKALGMEDRTGSIEVGKSADMILLDFTQAHLLPLYSVESQLVYSARGSDVDTVIVEGRVLMKNRKLLTMDEKEVLAKAVRLGAAIARSGSSKADGGSRKSGQR